MILANPRWEKFAQAIVEGHRQYRAYEKAGFALRGLRACGGAERLLKNPTVMARIVELRDEKMVAYRMSRRDVLNYLVDVIQTPAGQVKEGDRLCHSYRHTDRLRSASMPDKLKAAEMLAKICGWFAPEQQEHSGEVAVIVKIVGEDEDSNSTSPTRSNSEPDKTILRSTRYENFAQGVAEGKKPFKAYASAGFATSTTETAYGGSRKLMRKPAVLARIAELQREAEAECRINREQLLDFLFEVMLTPAGKAHEDHRVCQAFRFSEQMRWLKMPDKLKAAELVIRINGWNDPERVEHSSAEPVVIRIGGPNSSV
jgi:hypothetical protein